MVKKTTAKGKRTASKAAEEDSSLKKMDCDWGKSSVKATELDDLREKGLLPPTEGGPNRRVPNHPNKYASKSPQDLCDGSA